MRVLVADAVAIAHIHARALAVVGSDVHDAWWQSGRVADLRQDHHRRTGRPTEGESRLLTCFIAEATMWGGVGDD